MRPEDRCITVTLSKHLTTQTIHPASSASLNRPNHYSPPLPKDRASNNTKVTVPSSLTCMRANLIYFSNYKNSYCLPTCKSAGLSVIRFAPPPKKAEDKRKRKGQQHGTNYMKVPRGLLRRWKASHWNLNFRHLAKHDDKQVIDLFPDLTLSSSDWGMVLTTCWHRKRDLTQKAQCETPWLSVWHIT